MGYTLPNFTEDMMRVKSLIIVFGISIVVPCPMKRACKDSFTALV